jgi:3-deoxy-7-phosphoheptulonate synthase
VAESRRERWLVLDLERLPASDDPLHAEARELAGGAEPVIHDAGWACFLAIPVGTAGGRRAGDPALDLDRWRRHALVDRAWLQDDDLVLTGRHWPATAAAAGFEAAGWRHGSGELLLAAGPCAVESAAQMDEVAAACKEAGVRWLRGGAWKPRTSPYEFQGLGPRGLELLRDAADRHGLAVITEAIGTDELPRVAEASDVIQVGARNAQNFPLLRKLGTVERPVLLKRGFGCTLRELVCAAEYVLLHGNPRVLLCERGIRSFEAATRFTFDINAIPLLKQTVHLPVIADPSHGTGRAALVAAVARGAVAAGCDGLMFEVHPDPDRSLSDGRQAVALAELAPLVAGLRAVAAAVGRTP